MMVLRVSVDMPELPPSLLLPLDKLADGVETEREVELLSDPSEAVTTMTVVAVVGVALLVVDEAVSPEEVVSESASVVEVVWPGAGVVWEPSLVEVVCWGDSTDAVVVAVVVASDVVVASVEVLEVEDVVSDVVVDSALVDSLVVVAAGEFPLPLASALLESEPCLLTKAFVSCRPKIATLMKKPSATEVADRAATTNLSTLVERMVMMLSRCYRWAIGSCVGRLYDDKRRCNAFDDCARRGPPMNIKARIPEKATGYYNRRWLPFCRGKGFFSGYRRRPVVVC